jgi:hypothetical protein
VIQGVKFEILTLVTYSYLRRVAFFGLIETSVEKLNTITMTSEKEIKSVCLQDFTSTEFH